MKPLFPPPPVLTGLYVAAFAHVDESVVFEQRFTLSVDGRWLERVPGIAICQDFDSREYSVQYCDEDWELLAISGNHASVDEAKARVERSYHGITARWIEGSLTFEQAQAVHAAELQRDACSFCGKTSGQVPMMFGEDTRICGDCVVKFHRTLHSDDEVT